MNKFLCLLVALFVLSGALALEAQESLLHPAKVGIAAGAALRLYSQMPFLSEDVWAGVLFHIVPAVAVRPSLVFYKLDGEDTDNLTPTSSTTSEDGGLGFGLGAFYFTGPKRNFMLYMGPEVKYFFSTKIDFYDSGDKKSDINTRQLTAAVLIGAQYMVSDRFGFQADAGFGMLKSSELEKAWSASGTLTSDRTIEKTTFFMRSAYLGAVLYFN
jgi:hypothetical protein